MRDILSDVENKTGTQSDPMRDVQKQTALPKRFYKDVTVEADNEHFCIKLDGKSVKTPAKNVLSLPTKDLADKVAGEWGAQEEHIDPAKMPLTRMTNTAIDGVKDNAEAVFEEITRFCGTDMLFYRADAPDGLVKMQMDAWDPVLDWAENLFNARFNLAAGIMHVDQPPEAIRAFANALRNHNDAFALTALHAVTTLTGSALLALYMAEKQASSEDIWRLAHIDEDWNISQWGEDDEAMKRRLYRWKEMQAADALLNK